MITKRTSYALNSGFTLIEISIVLVIIGLLVGGVLVGQDLIQASRVRGQIAQVDKYKTAVNAFKLKYNTLPGDINAPSATAFGFVTRGSYPGQGDGNGILEGNTCNGTLCNSGVWEAGGEILAFWNDLKYAQLNDFSPWWALPDYSFNVTVGAASIYQYLPAAKLANGSFLYVWSQNGINYYGMSTPSLLGTAGVGMNSVPAVSVMHAFNIDTKMDDGFPQTGTVTAQYVNNGVAWAGAADTSSTAASATTCYDNGAVASGTQRYSTAQNKGNGTNCALSFRF